MLKQQLVLSQPDLTSHTDLEQQCLVWDQRPVFCSMDPALPETSNPTSPTQIPSRTANQLTVTILQ